MNFLDRILDRFYKPIKPLPSGIYNLQSEPETGIPYRLHLRVEQDGSGILILNARTVLHLNQTATEHIYHLVQRTSQDDAINQISRRYRVKPAQVEQDFIDIQNRLQELIFTPDLDPETYLNFERTLPYSKALSAPFRLDCALTYQSNTEDIEKVAPVDRVRRELLFTEWQTILDKAWKAGIPHIIFTGGEPTLRPDLPDLIAYAEKIGQVTGLLTNGFRLTNPEYLHQLLQNGLDHIMILLEPKEEYSWEAIRDVLAEDIHLTVHLTITEQPVVNSITLVDRLASMGVKAISLSIINPDCTETLNEIRSAVADRHMVLVWDIPVPYSSLNPVALENIEQAEAVHHGAGHDWLYVEPDGDVLPGQGLQGVLGNLLNDEWDKIWSVRNNSGA